MSPSWNLILQSIRTEQIEKEEKSDLAKQKVIIIKNLHCIHDDDEESYKFQLNTVELRTELSEGEVDYSFFKEQASVAMAESQVQGEYLDVLTKTGDKTGISKPRHVLFSVSVFNLVHFHSVLWDGKSDKSFKLYFTTSFWWTLPLLFQVMEI